MRHNNLKAAVICVVVVLVLMLVLSAIYGYGNRRSVLSPERRIWCGVVCSV